MDDGDKMLEYKGYAIVGDGSYGYKSIKPIGKGSVHLELRNSRFTNDGFAKRAIDAFLAKQPEKVVKKKEAKDDKND